jgi:regulator of sigma E protease
MTLVYFLIVIGILVFVHEFGHFIMAKRAGVRVEKFSLGMGPKLIGRKWGETEYLISALPLGGYVKMAGEEPDEEKTGAEDEFPSKSVWQRISIGAAGATMNIILAFAIMPLVFLIGASVPAYLDEPAVIGWVQAGSAAEAAGLQRGDRIVKIKGRETGVWSKALEIIAANPASELTVVVRRAGSEKELKLTPRADREHGAGDAGILPEMPPRIKEVISGKPAEQAGIKAGDVIVEVNGKPVEHWVQFSEAVKASVGREMTVTVRRGGKTMSVKVTPAMNERLGYGVIGVVNDVQMVRKRYGIIDSVRKGVGRTVELFGLTLDVLKQLFTFKLSIKSLGGPIMIAQMSGEAARSGITDYLSLLSFISLQLGILNLLPIPVLDGGLIVFLLIEAVRKKPFSDKVMEISQGIGMVLLLSLIAVVSYNDVIRVFFNK